MNPASAFISWIRDRLVPEARAWWKLWSIRFNALGLAVLAWVQVDPVSVLAVWNMMPPAVTHVIPASALMWIGMALFVLSSISRLVVQPKVRKTDG
ncbi:putative holin [Microcystis phage Mae-JY29]